MDGQGAGPVGSRRDSTRDSIRDARRREAVWLGAALLTVYAVWLLALIRPTRRYFLGDTQNAYYGWMYEFGTSLRQGQWPILDPGQYASGNNIAEGQMGLFSPLSALWALGSTVAPNLVVYATLLKFAVATIGIVGGYLLARSYGVPPPWAAVVAIVVPLCGFTLMSEAPRWFAGQQVAALLPWAWLGVKRLIEGRHPLPALVAGYLVVSVGYVYGTMFLIIVLAGLLLEALAQRREVYAGSWRPFLRGLGASLWCGLIAVAVYLPGVLTAPVTTRRTKIGGDGPLQLPWDGFLGLHLPMIGNPGSASSPTFTYVVWFLPLAVLVDWRAAARHWRSLVSLFVPAVLMLVWSYGPYNLGPIRWPGRILDAYTLVLGLGLVVLLTRHARDRRLGPLGLGVLGVWFVAGAVVRICQEPSGWPTVVVVSLLLAAVVLRVIRLRAAPHARPAALVLAASVVVGVFATLGYPNIATPQANMPSDRAGYRDYLPDAVGPTLIIHDSDNFGAAGNKEFYTPDRAKYVLTGSLYTLTGKPVVNSYTTIGFEPYSDRFRLRFSGDHFPGRLKNLISEEPTTGMRWIDLLGIRTLAVGKIPAAEKVDLPPQWQQVGENPYQRVYVRKNALPPPGSVAWSGKGVRLSEKSSSRFDTSFTVDAVPPGGGNVVISRLAWPGYRVEGAEWGRPLHQMLLVVHLTPDDVGDEVVVSFRPPGWPLELGALVLAGGVALAWAAGATWAARRRT